ncbi:MAG: dicarboxylate/amino acid:cation symporter, partial [Phycisphaerae bacterium]
KEASDFLDTIRSMVPPNVISAAAEGQLLGLIVVALLVGFFLAKIPEEQQGVVRPFVEAVYTVTLSVTDLVLRLAPIGVLALIAATFAEQFAKLWPDARFAEFLVGISKFAAVALAALLVHFLVTMPLILLFVARVNPLRHYKAMAPALATAFSTASSSATLPVTLDCVEKRAGVSNKTASFVLPLGATVNMDGTALYECVAAIFICQAFGLDLTFGQQFLIVITALLTSVGVAGVPSASLVAIAVILGQVEAGLAAQGITVSLISGMALLFVFDRPLDMCRTALNIFSDSVGAVTIARTEGETAVLADDVPPAVATEAEAEAVTAPRPLSKTGLPG